MRKVLLSSSAIALATAVVAPANAAEVELKIGGFVETYIGYGSTDIDNLPVGTTVDFDGVDAKWDGEIFFLPSITLDNGIKIGANIQLEANNAGDRIDENFVQIKGSFGEVLVGDENSAGYKMTYAAPDVSFFGVNSGSTSIFVNFGGVAGATGASNAFRATLGATFVENGANNDAARITYFTPRFAGFQLGVSYARDATQNNQAPVNLSGAAVGNIFDVGANYVNSFGGVDVGVSARWGIASDDRVAVPGTDIGQDPEVWGAGFNLGFGGFTIGGSFAEQNNAGNLDGTGYDLGVSYRTGPWGFSATWMHGENVANEVAAAAAGEDEELDQYLLAVDYDLAKGLDLNLIGGYVDFQEGPLAGNNDIDGFFVATGLRLRF